MWEEQLFRFSLTVFPILTIGILLIIFLVFKFKK